MEKRAGTAAQAHLADAAARTKLLALTLRRRRRSIRRLRIDDGMRKMSSGGARM